MMDCEVSIHGPETSPHVLLGPSFAPDLLEAPFLRLIPHDHDALEFKPSAVVFQPRVASQFRNVQVSVPTAMAVNLGLSRNSRLFLEPVDETEATASHVEICFRDQYLTRGDIWRLVQDELSGHCLHRGQSIDFLGTIKVRIKALYRAGRKVDSAFFGPLTKPIFRSEAARYVLYIQMAREMGDFDIQGSGELMYDKVVNGFLPDLFRRWHDLQVHHLVSIVLFSRMLDGTDHQDFYRVVVSDMPSVDVAAILDRLKREMLNFLPDVSIVQPRPNDLRDHLFASAGVEDNDRPSHIIAGIPASARAGNILEAINLASLQFATDHVDRDLMRTGVSVVVVTPGVGLFDVPYDLLKATTENLSEHGVSIDLVCLAPMPLHSVPLFRYEEIAPGGSATPSEASSFQSVLSKDPHLSYASSHLHDSAGRLTRRYGVPHWLNISFWKRPLPSTLTFQPAVRMHEIQMMGITSSLRKPISIPSLLFKSPTFSLPSSYSPDLLDRASKKSTTEPAWMDAYDAGVFATTKPSKTPRYRRHLRSATRMVSKLEIAPMSQRINKTESLLTNEVRKAQSAVTSPGKLILGPKGVAVTVSTAAAVADTIPAQASMAEKKIVPSKPDGVRPITIKQDAMMRIQNGRSYHGRDILAERVDTLKELCNPEAFEVNSASPDGPTLSSKVSMAPWLTLLNPCNPGKAMMTAPSRLGRWQHVFPRPLKTAQMKWNSLCSPAVVPLTTAEFPSPEQWADEYAEIVYEVPAAPDTNVVAEMIYLRLAKGFQFVVGERVAHTLKRPKLLTFDCFSANMLTVPGDAVCLMKGGVIHVLRRTQQDLLRVLVRSRYLSAKSTLSDQWLSDTPSIKSMLGIEYKVQEVTMIPPANVYDWERIDAQLAVPQAVEAEDIKPWMTRFVLVPTTPSAEHRRALADTEEEIHIEGIQKLVQIWQKNVATPCEIHYYTRDPSAVVHDEIQHLAFLMASQESDPHTLSRTPLDLSLVAARMQNEGGISIVDRRWHWRLHQYCFIGSELVTWLMANFAGVESREDAAALGNELMEQGLFRHVDSRHQFRDGNYFYQIADQHRSLRPKSLLPRSSPSSPLRDIKTHTAPVMLTEAVMYSLDDRRGRSPRQERMMLHYDKVHNPSSCFHIRLEWLNTTAKLVLDCIVSWARTLEPFGLRLVEVPIGEASSITHSHPFRAPYLIKLATRPPLWGDQSLVRAILQRFGYVLDFESVSAFSAQIPAAYSWGRPDYRYAQFIHQSGLLLAQITSDGNILLLANRLYNSQSSARRRPVPASPFPVAQDKVPASPFSRPIAHESPGSSPKRPEAVSSGCNAEPLARSLEAFCQSVTAVEAFASSEQERSPQRRVEQGIPLLTLP